MHDLDAIIIVLLDRLDLCVERIEAFGSKHGAADIDQLTDWMNTAFGYDKKRAPEPLDQRLHRRLGELYAKGGRPKKAAEQFDLARRLAPRDIYILRNLGKAYLDQNELADAEKIISLIEKFDPGAFSRDIEAATFKARWQRKKGNREGARQTAKAALESNAGDHYLTDILAQLQAELHHIPEARETYGRLLAILERRAEDEHTLWTRASGLNAALVAGSPDQRKKYYQALVASRPTSEEVGSIVSGLNTISKAFDIDVSEYRLSSG